MRNNAALTLSAILLASVTACSGGTSGIPAGSTSSLVASPSQRSTAAAPNAPHFTYYRATYGGNGASSPFALVYSALAVNPLGTRFYYYDENFDWVGVHDGSYSFLPFEQYSTPQGVAQEMMGYAPPFAYDDRGTLYGLAQLPTYPYTMYLVVYPEQPSKSILIPLGTSSGQVNVYDMEADRDGRILIAGDIGLIAVSDPCGKATVTTYIPKTAPGFYRVTEAANKDIYASTIGDFSHVYQFSPRLALKRIIADNAAHTDSLTPDPTGGIWFSDNNSGTFGRIAASGSVKTYSPSFNARDVATAKDGSVWVEGVPFKGFGTIVARVGPSGTTVQCAFTTYEQGYASGFVRGTYGVFGAKNALYSVDESGDILVVSL